MKAVEELVRGEPGEGEVPQPILVRRNNHDVGMVGHQAIGPDLGARLSGGISQQIKVERIVAVFEECLLAAVTPLRDMMWNAGNDYSSEAGHWWRLGKFGVVATVTEIITVIAS